MLPDPGVHQCLGAVLPVDVVALAAGLDGVGQAEQALQRLTLPLAGAHGLVMLVGVASQFPAGTASRWARPRMVTA